LPAAERRSVLHQENPLDLQALANLGEFIGGVVVLITLGYLALQVRQNNQALRTENYARAVDRTTAMQSKLAQDGNFAQLLARGANDATQLTPLERIQFTWLLTELLTSLEFMFHADREQALPEEVWARWSLTIAWWFTFPGVRAWWYSMPTPFSPSFTSFIESILQDNPADLGAAERFQEFLAGASTHEGDVERDRRITER
jgi:hypothetical protein